MRTALAALALALAVAGAGCSSPSITARVFRVTWTHDGETQTVKGTYDLWTENMIDLEITGPWDDRLMAQYNKEADRAWDFWRTTVTAVAAGAKELVPILVSLVKPAG